MTENAPDVTTKSAETLSGIARVAASLGSIAFIIGLALLIVEGGDAGILTACLYGGGLAAFIGLVMLTIQSAAMLIIREMWAIEHRRDRP
ncbi:MAG: hypothetical protein ACIAQF_12890 [Phycisphaerales bacterium JB065]